MNHLSPVDVEGQEAAKAVQAKALALQSDRLDEALKWLATGERGRRILRWLFKETLVWDMEAAPSVLNTNAQHTGHNDGRRTVGLMLRERVLRVASPSVLVDLKKDEESDARDASARNQAN